jgi:hypothetical protein
MGCADVMTKLFEMVANVVQRQEEPITASYGPGQLLKIVQRMYREADIQACLIFDSFLDQRQFERKVHEVKKMGKLEESMIEPRELDLVVAEGSVISQRVLLFEKFCQTKATSEFGTLKELTKKEALSTAPPDSINGLPTRSKIRERIEEMMEKLLLLENYYLKISFKKVRNDQVYIQRHWRLMKWKQENSRLAVWMIFSLSFESPFDESYLRPMETIFMPF